MRPPADPVKAPRWHADDGHGTFGSWQPGTALGEPPPDARRLRRAKRSRIVADTARIAADPRPFDEPTQVQHLATCLRWILPSAFVFGSIEMVLAALLARPTALVAGGAVFAYGLWLLWFRHRMPRWPVASAAHRLAGSCLVVLVGSGLLQPLRGEALALGVLIPIAISLPLIERTAMRRLLVLGWAVGVAGVVGSELFPNLGGLPPGVTTAMRVAGVGIILALVLVLFEQVYRRLSDAAGELASLAAMSSELAGTLDPLTVGDVMARRIAVAVGAEEAGICYWDRKRDAVLTYGYFPKEQRDDVELEYLLADYPETRRVLDTCQASLISDADPTADPNELRYLATIGQHALAMIPLVAKGRALGVLELAASDARHFDARRMALATTLAAEASLALENAVLHQELRGLAYQDPLTGLANRALLRQRAEAAIGRVRTAEDGLVALLYLDLDDLKVVNDTLGHGGGDDLLMAAGERIRAAIRTGDLAARLGGDEFAVLLEGLTDEQHAVDVGERIVSSLAEPFAIEGTDVRSGGSLGVAYAPFDVADPSRAAEELLDRADEAMYAAKRGGKGRVEVAEGETTDGAWSSAHDPDRIARRAGARVRERVA
jgi:diguanylate cyclase (GGDEF)-like protein